MPTTELAEEFLPFHDVSDASQWSSRLVGRSNASCSGLASTRSECMRRLATGARSCGGFGVVGVCADTLDGLRGQVGEAAAIPGATVIESGPQVAA